MATNTTPTRVTTLNPGDCFILPDGAEIVSVIINGTASVSSTCEDSLPIGTYKCWRFYWEDADAFSDGVFRYLQIGGTKYTLPDIAMNKTLVQSSAGQLAYYIPIVTPSGLVIDIDYDPSLSNPNCITFKIPDVLGEPILFWNNPGFGDGTLIPLPDICSCTS